MPGDGRLGESVMSELVAGCGSRNDRGAGATCEAPAPRLADSDRDMGASVRDLVELAQAAARALPGRSLVVSVTRRNGDLRITHSVELRGASGGEADG